MSGGVEALYIYDHHNVPILKHTYRSRHPSDQTLLSLYLAHPAPRPPLICLTDTTPPTLLFSIIHAGLLFLSPASTETEPLVVLEFLHRVVDTLEEFLGAPLLPGKIENAYDVVAQLLGEMCDAGAVNNTEPNTLRDTVEVPGWVDKLLGGLPGSSITPTQSSTSLSLQRPSLNQAKDIPQLPWRRANVRHTSNELYVDILESLKVTVAPSGRPLIATAQGSVAFTSRLSGVPDLLLVLSAPGDKAAITRTLELPVFHPCVRLNHWKSNPGELSFVPPDGRFVLAGYEVDLLPATSSSSLSLPASIEMRTGLGTTGTDFEVQLTVSKQVMQGQKDRASFAPSAGAGTRGGFSSRMGTASPALSGSSSAPVLENLVVHVPVPESVRNITDLRASKGEAAFSIQDGAVEWRVPTTDSGAVTAALTSGTATLRCTVVGAMSEGTNGENGNFASGGAANALSYDYTEDDIATGYQNESARPKKSQQSQATQDQSEEAKLSQSASLMPDSATVSFNAKGWLASGVRVESLVVNTRSSRGLPEGVRPYKGVKYLTVSRRGVEVRG